MTGAKTRPDSNFDADIDYVNRIFPEIAEIGDPELARIVAEIWVDVWKESGWARIEDCPKNPLSFDIKLVPHVRSITRLSIQFAETILKFHSVPGGFDMDMLIAGSILHDVDKLLIYDPTATTVVKTQFSKLLPHGTYTGYKMLEKGLSMDLVNVVVAHSEKATHTEPVTAEGMIMKHVDHGESMVMNLIIKQN
ncbi:MAG: HD domain-containing protein, partial [Phyllobacterium sp.]